MKLSAYEWGLKRESCDDALEARKNYASQPLWYRACDRGDWHLWQFQWLSDDEKEQIRKPLQDAINTIVDRAVRNYALKNPATKEWAEKWLSGEDRTEKSAESAAERAAERAAWAAWAAASAAWAAASAAWAAWAARAESAAWAAESAAESAAAWAAWAARAESAAASAAWAAELKQQAEDIHRFIPEWPGKEEGGEDE